MKTLLAMVFILGPSGWLTAQVRFGSDTVYEFRDDIIQKFNKGVDDLSRAATDFSFIEDYQDALSYGSKAYGGYSKITGEDSTFFRNFKPEDAKDYILRRAQSEKIIIINEAHHNSHCRVFVSSLLKGLYEQGYRFLELETLSDLDTTLSERGYPVINSGYYTVEPQFGDMVRHALSLGFKVFPYEASEDSIGNPKLREWSQARHILNTLNKNPEAKFLIYAGYDHIHEDSIPGWGMAMAGRLKQLSGIDPFTVDQIVLTERPNPELENPFYKMIDISTPTVFLDSAGNPFAGPEGKHYYDVRVAIPRTRYVNNRPDWLLFGNRKYYFLDKKDLSIGFPCLVMAYASDEDITKAVPIDVVNVEDESDINPLILSPGNYKLVVRSKNGKSRNLEIAVPGFRH